MQTADSNNIICKSYFQHASDSEISQSFTQKWIELINLLEKRNDCELRTRDRLPLMIYTQCVRQSVTIPHHQEEL